MTGQNRTEVVWRGSDSTRLEAFVDAAFAFAVTLLVISGDHLPESLDDLLRALKNLPAFAASFAMVAMFWSAHVRWARQYRMEGFPATLLSLLLVFLVLVYVYPLRLLFGTFFSWVTGGWVPMPLSDVRGAGDILLMFLAYGVAFASMSACIGGLYLLAWRARHRMGWDIESAAAAAGQVASHVYFVLVALLSILIVALLPKTAAPWQVALPGCVYFLLSFTGWIYTIGHRRAGRVLQSESHA
ncbi:TMEM175 family protein [Pseudoxanthomonas indica]|uniref:DUF1211 domain-containing protein n=1 Tax=Pseudoxanthomonas indica TaxID=428993 RepID=A0A1T5LC31_9GAMM|nr:TMEM175 family protein [Pseudoxanthomonas indica]SKC73199.1 Protein of unknown function [Pseudoxanthomonas indica]